jgi:Zn-dependent protease with chaperone function
MSGALAFIAACVGVGALVSLLVWPMAGLGLRAVVRRASAWPAARRADAAFLLGIAPALVAVAVSTATAMPSLMTRLGLAADHCGGHDHHVHVCMQHVGHLPTWLVAFGAAASLLFVARAARLAVTTWGARRRFAALERLSVRESTPEGCVAFRVPGSPRLCLATGVLRPRIFYSASLAEHLSAQELAAALAHEAAHLRRRDPVALAVLDLAALISPPPHVRSAREAFRAAAEQACDVVAAAEHGGASVARALVSAARLQWAMSGGLAFAEHGLAERVAALLKPRPDAPAPARTVAAFCGCAVAVAVVVTVGGLDVHHAVETLLSRLD